MTVTSVRLLAAVVLATEKHRGWIVCPNAVLPPEQVLLEEVTGQVQLIEPVVMAKLEVQTRRRRTCSGKGKLLVNHL